MNKNKIFFSILGAILFGLVVILVINLNSSTTGPQQTTPKGDLTLWILGDDGGKFQEYLTQFKTDTGKYGSKTIVVESFSDYETYKETLTAAFLLGEGPDIFVLNNNEQPILENQTLGIDPNFISPNDFRKVYKGIFGDDLITTLPDDSTVEFLKGIPIGYETLGVYFNRRYFKSDTFETWTSLNSSLGSVTSKNTSITPVGLGNGNVVFAPDIMMQIFVSLGDSSLIDLSANTVKQGLQTYLGFGSRRGENAYNELSPVSDTLTNVDYFSRGDVVAIAGYPRLLEEIEKKGYQKNFLLANPFPQFVSGEKKSLLNYNYFVVNKDTQNQTMVNDLFAYMVSTDGVEAYLDFFPYYLPALVEVEEDILEKKINPNFNIVYKDFINRDATETSFNAGNRVMFESGINSVLSVDENNDALFESLKSRIICATNKATNFTNLSSSCK